MIWSPFLKLCNAEKGLLRQSTLNRLLLSAMPTSYAFSYSKTSFSAKLTSSS